MRQSRNQIESLVNKLLALDKVLNGSNINCMIFIIFIIRNYVKSELIIIVRFPTKTVLFGIDTVLR